MPFKGAVFTILVCHCVTSSLAAKRVDAHLRARETLKRRRSEDVIFQRRDEVPLDTSELFQLTEGESLEAVRETKDAAGTVTERLKETYKNIEVYDAVVTVRKTADGQLTGEATGVLIQEIGHDLPDTEAKLTDEETLEIALKEEGDDISELAYANYTREIYIDRKNQARLVNVLSYIIEGVKRPFYIIDVRNGEILKHWQGLSSKRCGMNNYKVTGGNERMGTIPYGERPFCIHPKIVKRKCFLENKYVRVVDMKFRNDSSSYKPKTANFICKRGYLDQVNGGFSPAIDAFFYGSVVGKMFEDWFGSKPLMDKILIRVHYGLFFENAYWDGVGCTFGDGGDYFYPLTSLDIVGHEIAHGVTEQGSGLVYEGESGGVDEAFSDIIGEAAEQYIQMTDFMTGHGIMKHGQYMREFEHPENDGKSISNVNDMEETLDPHYSSGVYRRVFYLVVQEGMSVRHATAVFLHANRMFWHRTSSFYDTSCGVLKAALDLGYDTVPFRKAFKDVSIEKCDVSTYVFALSNNETRFDVEVSGIVNPVFKLETPSWADEFMVDIKGNNQEKIEVIVMTGGWEQYEDESKTVNDVARGSNNVRIPNAADNEFFIKLSLSSKDVDETTPSFFVDLNASYSCLNNYKAHGLVSMSYKRDCRTQKSARKKSNPEHAEFL